MNETKIDKTHQKEFTDILKMIKISQNNAYYLKGFRKDN